MDEKDKLLERLRKFWKILKISLQKNCIKCIILAYFSNKLTNYALIFCAFGRKTQIVGKFWENFDIFWGKFYRKIEFFIFIFYRKFVNKNRAFGNNTIFLQQIFWFRGVSQFFTKYFLDFWLRSESIDLRKITPVFYNHFSDLGWGVASPLSTVLIYIWF